MRCSTKSAEKGALRSAPRVERRAGGATNGRVRSFLAGFVATMLLLIVIGLVAATFYTGTGQIISTVAAGTAPFIIKSTTMVANLNANYLNGVNRTDLLATCKPRLAYLSTEWYNTFWHVVVSCTNCRGQITHLGLNGRTPSDDTPAHMRVVIDGINTTFTTPYRGDRPEEGNYSQQFIITRSRFLNNMSVLIRANAAGASARGFVVYCLE